MHADLADLLFAGLAGLAAAGTALTLLVRRDLVPITGSDPGVRWLVAGGLGLGVIAFAVKLAVVIALSRFPAQLISPLIAAPVRVVSAPLPDPVTPPFRWQALPDHAPAPPDNLPDAARIALGERLFHDPRLSATGTLSCAGCHDVRGGSGADGRRTAVGVNGLTGPRNTPTVWNAAFQARLFWDGRATSLEEQALGPLLNPIEMALPSVEALEAIVGVDAGYRAAFAEAYPGRPLDGATIAMALASYERSLITPDSPYDRFVRGDAAALTPAQKRGMWTFRAVGCVTCHSGPNFSGAALIGPRNPFAPLRSTRSPLAQGLGLEADRGAAGLWRIPSLRNVALTAPYFHNGAVTDLTQAVRLMADAQLDALARDGDAAFEVAWSRERGILDRRRPRLDDAAVADVVAFLHALTSDSLAARAARYTALGTEPGAPR